jgi:hypothetical protein
MPERRVRISGRPPRPVSAAKADENLGAPRAILSPIIAAPCICTFQFDDAFGIDLPGQRSKNFLVFALINLLRPRKSRSRSR